MGINKYFDGINLLNKNNKKKTNDNIIDNYNEII